MPFFLAGLTILGLGVILPVATTLYFLLDAWLSLYRLRAKTNHPLSKSKELLLGGGFYLLSLAASFGSFFLGARFVFNHFSVPLSPLFLLLPIAAGLIAYITRKRLIPRRSLWLLIWPPLLGPPGFLLALTGIGRFGSPSAVLMANIESMMSSSCMSIKAFSDKACTNKREITFIARVPERVFHALINGQVFLSNDGDKLVVSNVLYSSNRIVSQLPVDINYPLGSIYNQVFSADGRRFAYRKKSNDGCVRLVVDGVESKCYQSAEFPVFSLNGQRLAYVASEPAQAEPRALFGKRQFVVIDGKEQKRYAFVDGSVLTFSRSGEHFVYAAGEKRGGPFFLVVDGREFTFQDPIEPMGTPVVTDDGRHVAFISERCVKPGHCEERVILDGKAGKGYERISSLAIIPGSNQVIYLGEDGKKTRVVQGSTESDAFDIAELVLSQDRKHLAYLGELISSDAHGVNLKFKAYLHVDGKNLGPFDGSLYGPTFSADGLKIAWLVDSNANDKALFIRDNPTGEEKRVVLGWDFPPGLPLFSSDSTRIAFRDYYSDQTNWGTISFFNRGKLQGGYVHDWISEPVFSDDGDSVAYWALDGSKLSYIREHLD